MSRTKPVRVLIVEGAFPVGVRFAAALDDEGMLTTVVGSGPEALVCKRTLQPDVVVIDLDMAEPDELSLVQTLASHGDCGVIVVADTDVESMGVARLDAGADDFIVKPVLLRELAARIRAVHRRLSRNDAPGHGPRVRVDSTHRALIGPGPSVTTLTEAEFAVLLALLDAEGGAVSRDWLGRVALKRSIGGEDRSIDQLVMKLRRKLAQHGVPERTILSTRGLGYAVPEPGMFDLPRLPPVIVGQMPMALMEAAVT